MNSKTLHDEIDNHFKAVGEFGPYQLKVFILVGLVACIPSIIIYSNVFISATPEYRCKINEFDNSYEADDLNRSQIIKAYIPIDDGNQLSRCLLRNYSSIVNGSFGEDGETYLCNSWVFSKQYYGQTIVSDWNLVCNRSSWKSTFSTIFFIGANGGIISGILSDKIGRKKATYIFILCNAIIAVLLAIFTNLFDTNLNTTLIIHGILRFLSGLVSNIYPLTVVLVVEITGPSKRLFASNSMYYFFIFGEYISVFIAFFIRDYKQMYICLACIMSSYLFYFWFVPESPRWYFTNGKSDDGYKVLKKIANANKKPMPENNEPFLETNLKEEASNDSEIEQSFSFRKMIPQMLKSKVLVLRSFIILFNWIVVSCVYFGISLGTGELFGNPYLNFTMFATVELLAIMFGQFAFDKFGRKAPYAICTFTAGLSLLIVMFIPKSTQYLVTVMAIIGKFTISFSLNGLIIITSEVYPTVIRNTFLASSQAVGRLGSIVAPYINLLSEIYWYPLSFIIYGAIATVASILAFIFIPETKGVNLPNTIKDMK